MPETKSKSYRKDIQGLRGLAVLLVLIFHTDVTFSGGFIGVDVFFVISGFVITQLLLEELENSGNLNLKNFYTRRARRLLPTLALVTISTVGISLLVFSPFGAQQDVVATARATSIFGANIYFLLQNTYEILGANPLRQMWSLSVEEQFYFLFPLFVMLIWKLSIRLALAPRRFLTWVILLVGVFSFVVSYELSVGRVSQFIGQYLASTPQRIAFFAMPTRAWEFAVGALALVLVKRGLTVGSQVSNWATLLAFVVLSASAYLITTDDPFPGILAILPVLCTATLLVCGRNSSFSELIFSNRMMTWLGDISYSLYLWHWPCVVFADTIWPGRDHIKVFATIFSFAPAFLTVRFFEAPIRFNSKLVGRRAALLGVSCILIPVATVVSSQKLTTEIQNYFPNIKSGWVEQRFAVVNGCFGKLGDDLQQGGCLFSTRNSNGFVLLLGDSQAASASDGFRAAAESLNLDFAISTFPGCPMFERVPRDAEVCKSVVARNLKLIEKYRPDVVVLSNAGFRYTWDGLEIPRSEILGGGLPSDVLDREISVGQSYSEMIAKIVNNGTPVVVVLESPFVQFTKQISLLRPEPVIVPTTLLDQISRRRINRLINDRFKFAQHVSIIDIDAVICPDGVCLPKVDDHWIYMENSHLNPDGSLLIKENIEEAVRKQFASGG